MKPRALPIIAALLVILAVAPGLAGDRILIVHSYHQEYDWVQGVNKGIMANLNPGVDHRTVYMDTKRHPSLASKLKAAEEARQITKAYQPEVVIAVDDNAQNYFVRDYAAKSPIQFVFCGVNEEPQKYGYPAANVTGILERAYPAQVLHLLKRIVPEALNVAWVSDDSPTAKGVLPRVQALARLNKLPLNIVVYKEIADFVQWQKTIDAFERDPGIHAYLIPLYHTVMNTTEGQSMLPADVMRWTVARTTKPIIGFWPFSTEDGALCAVAVDPYEHGKVAALMARQILSGKKASDLPIITNSNGYVILNLKTANKLGIDVPFEVIQSADHIIE